MPPFWGMYEIQEGPDQQSPVLQNIIPSPALSPPPAAALTHVGWRGTLGNRPQPSLAPSDYRASLKAATKLRNKAFRETRNCTRSQKQKELVNPDSPSVRNFPKHLCPALKQAGLTHTWDDKNTDPVTPWERLFKVMGLLRYGSFSGLSMDNSQGTD